MMETNKYIHPMAFKMLGLLLMMIAFPLIETTAQKKTDIRTLIVIFDGLRPDYITPELMPNLYRLREDGSFSTSNHSVFPTVTRVNASSYATGSYPATHGLMGNTVYFPKINRTKVYNSGEAGDMQEIAEATLGNLLTSVSFGELLQQNGERFMVFSSGSTGQAYLQNHKVAGGMVINPALILPNDMMPEVVRVLGSPPPYDKPNTARHKWVTDGLLHYGFADDGPLVSAIWYSDPDGTAHAEGIGAPLMLEALKSVDTELGRILQEIRKKKWEDRINILVSTDHGFVTNMGRESLTEYLIKTGLKKDKESDDVVLAGGAIYIKNRNADVVKRIVSSLQKEEWVGAIFTAPAKPGSSQGWVPGTLSFEAIYWNHERSADILVDVNWDRSTNKFGYEGATFYRGIAGHGGSSPYEIKIPLIAFGPSFRKQFNSKAPSSNIDLVPTILAMHNLSIPSSMQGRVLNELFNEPSSKSPETKSDVVEVTSQHTWGSYVLKLYRTSYGNHTYIDYTQVERIVRDPK